MDTDRNLLFAVIALRAGLIDADQCATVCDRWANQRTRPLADQLTQPTLLHTEDRMHLNYLMERHLQQHGGNAQAALGALADGNVRSALAGIRNGELRDWLSGALPGGLYLGSEVRTRPGKGLWIALGIGAALLILLAIVGVFLVGTIVSHERMMMEAQARMAEAQALAERDRAQANLREEDDLVHQVIIEIAGTLDGAESGKLRERLLEQILKTHLDRLAQAPNDANVRRAAVSAHETIGEHYRKQGELQKAEAALQQAVNLANELVNQHSQTHRYRRDLGRCQARLAATQQQAGKPKEAEATLRLAVNGFRFLRQNEPSNQQHQYELACVLNQLARLMQEVGRLGEVDLPYAEAYGDLQFLSAVHPKNTAYRLELARCHFGRGVYFRAANRTVEADAELRTALGILETLIAEQPKDAAFRQDLLAVCEALVKDTQGTTHQQAAEAVLKKAKALQEIK